jgi:ubiquinol-cytochrome c reductase subunit 9
MASVSTPPDFLVISCRVDIADGSPSPPWYLSTFLENDPCPFDGGCRVAASPIRPLMGTWHSPSCMCCEILLRKSSIPPAWNRPSTPSLLILSRPGICLTPAADLPSRSLSHLHHTPNLVPQPIYTTLFKRNSVFVTSVFLGAFGFSMGFDLATSAWWDAHNRGVSGASIL